MLKATAKYIEYEIVPSTMRWISIKYRIAKLITILLSSIFYLLEDFFGWLPLVSTRKVIRLEESRSIIGTYSCASSPHQGRVTDRTIWGYLNLSKELHSRIHGLKIREQGSCDLAATEDSQYSRVY